MNAGSIKLYNIFHKELSLSEEKAQELVQAIDEAVKINNNTTNSHATKEFVKDEIHRLELKVEQTKSELSKAIFWTSLIQFLAIVGSVIGIITFMLKK